MATESMEVTIESFGCTTFRLTVNGVVIFLDSWLDRTKSHTTHLAIDDVPKADYICISHAHFDHLPGADRLALRTGARVIANPEAIRILREAGVPEEQLITVAGGERIPLFHRDIWEKVRNAEGVAPTLQIPGAPPRPDPALATLAVDIWPSLHALMSWGEFPEEFDLGQSQPKPGNEWKSTLDISYGMKWDMMRLPERVPPEVLKTDPGLESLSNFLQDPANKFSNCDGGQLMYNFRFGGASLDEKVILWNGHMGAYDGIMRTLTPKPDVAILGANGEVNLNGRPFKGTAAQFLRDECEWLEYPETIIWCLHDESPFKPYRANTKPATELIERTTRCRVVELKPAMPHRLFNA